MLNVVDASRQFVASFVGPARDITTAAAGAVRNATALPVGRYIFKVVSGSCFVRQGVGTVVAADGVANAAADMRFDSGEAFYLSVTDVVNSQFLSVIRVGATNVTLRVCRVDEDAPGAVVPPAWA